MTGSGLSILVSFGYSVGAAMRIMRRKMSRAQERRAIERIWRWCNGARPAQREKARGQ